MAGKWTRRFLKNPDIHRGCFNQRFDAHAVYSEVVVHYMKRVGTSGDNMGVHTITVTPPTSSSEYQVNIAKVQE